jgi:hypothetical protein
MGRPVSFLVTERDRKLIDDDDDDNDDTKTPKIRQPLKTTFSHVSKSMNRKNSYKYCPESTLKIGHDRLLPHLSYMFIYD